MPIGSGARGRPGVLGVPALNGERRMGDLGIATGGIGGPQQSGVGRFGNPTGTLKHRTFLSVDLNTKAFTISGVTKDSSGAALDGVTVELFLTQNDIKIAETVSDGSGNYSFGATAGPYYIVAYKAGAPDVSGTTVNTLTGV